MDRNGGRELRNTNRKMGIKEMFYLMIHSTHFIFNYMVSDT